MKSKHKPKLVEIHTIEDGMPTIRKTYAYDDPVKILNTLYKKVKAKVILDKKLTKKDKKIVKDWKNKRYDYYYF